MKRILIALALVLGVTACARPQYEFTEGPLRASFTEKVSLLQLDQTTRWENTLLLAGVIDRSITYHIEGWVGPHQTFHTDSTIPYRTIAVRYEFTLRDYCEAMGMPLDRFDPANQFYNRTPFGDTPGLSYNVAPEDEIEGKIKVQVKIYNTDQAPDGRVRPTTLATQAVAQVQLTCTSCRCDRPAY